MKWPLEGASIILFGTIHKAIQSIHAAKLPLQEAKFGRGAPLLHENPKKVLIVHCSDWARESHYNDDGESTDLNKCASPGCKLTFWKRTPVFAESFWI